MKRSLILLLNTLFYIQLCAQHNTSSPYSMFGVGEIETGTYGMNSGMAGSGIGLYVPGFLNIANPAAIAIDSLSFIFDVSTSAKISRFSLGEGREKATSANLKKIAMGFRTIPKLSLSLGLMPYSSVEYKLRTGEIVEGTNQQYDMLYEGNGGFTQIYLGGSYKLYPKWSLGVKAAYLFGTINDIQGSWTQSRTITSTGYKFVMDFGIIYNDRLNERTNLTIGATYGYKSQIKLNSTRTVSINNVPEIIPSLHVYIPQSIALGASLQKIRGRSHLIFAADYKFTDWGATPSPNKKVYYSANHRLNAGVQITPNYRTPRNYFQRMAYQAGGFYERSHLKIGGNNLIETGLSLGMIFPLGRRTVLFLSADLAHRGGTMMINENYLRLNLGVSLNEAWFIKWAYD
ncbi:MAG: hypothetical protein LBC98_05540 [Prevotellaceae bacterium]|nr:hypothetical protein [Prevotellaceae bacterium]